MLCWRRAEKMDLDNFNVPRLNNYQLLSEVATLGFVSGNETAKDLLEVLSSLKIFNEIYQRVNGDEAKLDALRAKTILKISDYVKKNPKASQDQLAKEVQKEIKIFAQEASAVIN